MKILSSIMAVLFVLFLYWQLNDPDSLMWILIYGYPLVLSILVVMNKKYIMAHLLGALGYFLAFIPYLVFKVPEYSFDDEYFREAFGLLFVSLWLGGSYFWFKKNNAA